MPSFARTPQKAPQPGAFLLCRLRNRCVSLAFLFVVTLFLAPLAAAEEVTVRQVLDGDSVVLADQRQVRLVGINAPEFGKDGKPDEPLAVAARDRLRGLTEGKALRLVLEEEQRDRYGRWLAHLTLPDGTSVEEILLKEGLAAAIAIPPNIALLTRLQAAEAQARKARRGLWGNVYYAPVGVESLTPAHAGFHFVRGTVTHVGRSAKFVYLDMGPQFALRIAHTDWQKYFRGRAEDWRGKQIVARGWISAQNGRLHMSIGHPAMLERLP